MEYEKVKSDNSDNSEKGNDNGRPEEEMKMETRRKETKETKEKKTRGET